MRVDLPAPFSPRRACTWPSRTVRLTPWSAFTPGKLFPMPRISSRTFPGTAAGCRMARASLPAAVGEVVHRGRQDDQDAGDEDLVVGADAHELQPVAEHADDQGAHQRPHDVAAAAEEAGPAQHHGGDGVE